MISGKGITYIAVNINHLQIIAHRTSNFNIINNCPEKQGNKFFNCPICVYFARPNYFRKKTRKMVQISQSTLDFLSDLKYNNEKDWFSSNRKRYEAARAEYDSFLQAVIGRITEMDPILKGLEAKSCIYRINRDIGSVAIKPSTKHTWVQLSSGEEERTLTALPDITFT